MTAESKRLLEIAVLLISARRSVIANVSAISRGNKLDLNDNHGLIIDGCILFYNRAFSRDVTRTKLIKNGRHFGVQHRFLEKLACLSMEPQSYIEALGAGLVGKEDEWTN